MAKATRSNSPKKVSHKKKPASKAKAAPASAKPAKAQGKLQQVAFAWAKPGVKPALGPKAPKYPKPPAPSAKRPAALRRPGASPTVLPKPPVKAPRIGERNIEDDMPAYLVAFRALVREHDMALWVAHYLKDEVAGIQAKNTLEAKVRDLGGFVQWMVQTTGQAVMQEWLPRDTQGYVRFLGREGKAASSINRSLASIRRFAHWAQDQPGGILQFHGSPVRGTKDLVMDEPECRKLDAADVHRLFRAADKLVDLASRSNARPRRNRAILSLLYHTGLRVSELTSLRLSQLKGKHLLNIVRKGRSRSKRIYLVTACLEALEDYLAHEREQDAERNMEKDPALFLSCNGLGLGRRHVAMLLEEIAQEASKRLKDPIELHPHRLRHTFGSLFREKSGSDTETAAALGHTSLAHVSRYVRKTQKEREEAMEGIFEG